MLVLDTKKIRKGRAIGLPYQGSKKKIAKQIIEIIKQNFGTDTPIYDIFGGGGAITAECLLNDLTVYYNDTNKMILDCFVKVIDSDFDYLKTIICSRDEFNTIYHKNTKTVDDYLKLIVNSFGNNRKNYLYNKQISDIKYKLAMKIIERHGVFGGYKSTETYKKEIKKLCKKYTLGNTDRLQQTERIQQLEQLSRLQQLDNMTILKQQPTYITNKSYEAFSHIENAILYLDPPYENCAGYDNAKNFNSQLFYDWVVNMSKKNIAIVSSYTISDKRFECVYEFKNARSTLQGGISKNKDKCERLFMVKDVIP